MRLSLEIKLRNRLGRTISEIHVHCIEENLKKNMEMEGESK